MKILVVAASEQCPAAAALRSMRLPFELVVAQDDFTYGQALERHWQAGEPFINVEHDIVPWPGALEALWSCASPEPWCGYPYLVGESGKLSSSIGCVLVRHVVPPVELGHIPWNRIDAAVYRVMGGAWHRHSPPVAHLTTMKILQEEVR